MKKIWLFFVLGVLACSVQAQRRTTIVRPPQLDSLQKEGPAFDFSPYESYNLIENNDTLPYRLLLPENYDTAKKYPLILFLHGSGERGSDNEKQLVHGAKMFLDPVKRQKFPAIVVFPQCPANSYWSNAQFSDDTANKTIRFMSDAEPTTAMKGLLSLTEHLQENYPVKTDQQYVMGLSMGGMGTFEIVSRLPNTFAAAVPICGGADTSTAYIIRKTAWWIFHGALNDVVPPQLSKDMVMALQKFYSTEEVNFTLYPQANHNSWDDAFKEPNLLPWLFSQKRKKGY